ncbi:MAG TPA: putative sugar nucleotidyl transferase [Saprospiraceae bacterium]|nr:putative sugar nucleotidyl transferase [Saprospiraceae bacterium]HPI06771.1 putative sugar nucleotidyl transferase [Saprospiraceae bacterium]
MLNIILFDSDARSHLQPLTSTRPMGELRLGILTLREKWERRLRGSVSYITQEYLQEKYPISIEDENLVINSGIIPTEMLCRRIDEINMGEALLYEGELVAARLNESQFEALIEDEEVRELMGKELESNIPIVPIERLWEMTRLNAAAILDDYQLITSGRKSQPVSPTNRIIGPTQNVFVEEGVQMECCILNAHDGPIYIGKDAVIMEGCMFRGPISIGADAIVKMGAKIYGPVSIGSGCRVGGEIVRSILYPNANKAHDGYLGDSVIGEWCNIGAATNNSNLKNNYSEVKLWDYDTQKFEKTGENFVGMIMGDHAKCGINTMFNTGTVVGVFANVFGAGYQRNFIPDFSWGGPDKGYRTYKFAEACETAEIVMARRNQPFTDFDKAILYHVYDHAAAFRTWEK